MYALLPDKIESAGEEGPVFRNPAGQGKVVRDNGSSGELRMRGTGRV